MVNTFSLEWVSEMLVEQLVDQHYAVIDQFIPTEEVHALRYFAGLLFDEGAFDQAGIGHYQDYQVRKEIRGDYIHWLTKESLPTNRHLILSRLETLIAYLNYTCFLGIKRYEMHFAVYPVGTFYSRHLDTFTDNSRRKLSVICYLNENWEPSDGGQLRLFLPTGVGGETTVDILPIGGRLVCFKSDLLEHEVLPTNRRRYSLTGWLRNDELLY